MTPEVALYIVMSISQFCQTYEVHTPNKRECYSQVWKCSHDTKVASSVPFAVHNCVRMYVDKEMDKKYVSP